MNELDGRKIARKTLETIRIRAVKRVEAGESPEVVIKALGLSRSLIYEWLAKYREGVSMLFGNERRQARHRSLQAANSKRSTAWWSVLIRVNSDLSSLFGLAA